MAENLIKLDEYLDIEPEVTSKEARALFEGFQDVREGLIPYNVLSASRKIAILESINRILYDSNARHLSRTSAAKGIIPDYDNSYNKLCAQTFGFEKQGLNQDEIVLVNLYEALSSNMYAAMDHVFMGISLLEGDLLKLINSGNTGKSIELLIKKHERLSSKILSIEEEIVNNKVLNQGLESYGFGFNFENEVEDRSYRNNPHWKTFGFNNYFMNRQKELEISIKQLGPAFTKENAPSVYNLISRLDNLR